MEPLMDAHPEPAAIPPTSVASWWKRDPRPSVASWWSPEGPPRKHHHARDLAIARRRPDQRAGQGRSAARHHRSARRRERRAIARSRPDGRGPRVDRAGAARPTDERDAPQEHTRGSTDLGDRRALMSATAAR